MKILVTGGAGFIGSYVTDALLAKGYQVRVLDNLDAQVHGAAGVWPEYLNPKAEKMLGDVRDRTKVAAALEGVDAVIHLAAAVGVGQSMYEIERYCSINIIGTAILLEEVVKRKETIKKIVVASSMSAYGEGLYQKPSGEKVAPMPRSAEQLKKGQWDFQGADGKPWASLPTPEDKPMLPGSVYATNKRDQEEMVLAVGRAYGIPAVAFRMWNVYGPRQALSNPYTGVVAIFSARLLNDQPPLVFEDGKQVRDFVQVEDVAQVYVKALETSAADGLAMNVGSGERISIEEVAKSLARVLKKKIEPVLTGKYRDGDIRHCTPDISLVRSKLNWTPRFNFEEGVKPLVEWLKNQRAEDNTQKAHEALKAKGLLK